ncbi:MAG: Gfo/Idh/MocA family oxidoreductase [bacterium]
MKEVRIGVIGVGSRGGMVRLAHRPKEGFRVIAGADINADNFKSLTDYAGNDIFVSKDYKALLALKDLDAVFIASPDFLHEEHALAALRAGKAVYLEKPMAITVEGCDRLLRTARKNGSKLYLGHNMRHFPVILKMKEIIDSGEIGDVVQIYFNYAPGPWTLEGAAWKVKRSSGGLFANKLNHYVDLLRWLVGKPLESVACTCAPKIIPYYEFTDNAFSTYRFEGGAIAQILFNQTSTALPYDGSVDACYRASGHRLEYTVVGTKGNLFVDIWHPSIRVIHNYLDDGKYYPRPNRTEDYHDLPTWKLYHNVQDETRDIVNRIASGQKEYITPDDAYQSTLACLGADVSMTRDGQPITMAEVEKIAPAPAA